MNIGIVGAGIMGRLLCWQLARAGHTTTLFEKDGFDTGSAAAHTAAGMLTPYAELESAEPEIFNLGMQSLSLWPTIMAELDLADAYFQQGSLVVAHGNDRADYQRFKNHVDSKLSTDVLAKTEINRDRLQQLEPELSDCFRQAMYFPEEAWLRTASVMNALHQQATALGSVWHPHTAVETVRANQIQTSAGEALFDIVIDCRGLGGKPDMPSLRGVRGELVWLQAPDVAIQRLVRLMHPRYGLYIVPQHQDDMYIVGATQIESDDSGPATVRSLLELLSAAYSIHPGFAEARVVDIKTNCRPALDDNLPRIEHEPGLFRINGLYRHGYLLAPALASHVLTQLNDIEQPVAPNAVPA